MGNWDAMRIAEVRSRMEGSLRVGRQTMQDMDLRDVDADTCDIRIRHFWLRVRADEVRWKT